MAHTLAAHTVSAAAADGRVQPSRARGSTAVVLLCGIIVALCTLTVRPQATRVAQADATLIGAIAVVANGAVGLGFGLALAVALKGDGDGEGVLEAHRLNNEGFLLLFGATTSPGLHTERDLGERRGLELYDVLGSNKYFFQEEEYFFFQFLFFLTSFL